MCVYSTTTSSSSRCILLLVREDVLEVYKSVDNTIVRIFVLRCVCVYIKHGNVALTTILSGQTVDAIISFSVTANETAQGVGNEAASQTTLGVDVANVKLNGSVVLGSDKAVGGRAGKVSALSVRFCISHSRQTLTNHLRGMYKSTSWPSEFSIVQQKRRSPCCRPRQGKFCVSIPLSHL